MTRWLLLAQCAFLAGACGESSELSLGGMNGEPAPTPSTPAPVSERNGPTSEAPSPIGSPDPVPQNSQTGSIGMVECLTDTDCVRDSTVQTFGPLGQIELVGAACAHLPGSTGALPVCDCRLRRTPPGDAGTSPEPYELSVYPGHRPGACSEWSITPGCLYCESEFPGCNIDDPQSCDGVCADMAARSAADAQRTVRPTTRLAICTPDTNRCKVVTEIEGRCYAGPPDRVDPPELDCNLSDAELIARLDDPSLPGSAPSCATPPATRCTSADECPRGLACNSGVCGPCSEACFYPEGQPGQAVCEGDSACAAGELCTLGACLPTANIGCRFFSECPADNTCSLSGISATGRGNAATHSFCQPHR